MILDIPKDMAIRRLLYYRESINAYLDMHSVLNGWNYTMMNFLQDQAKPNYPSQNVTLPMLQAHADRVEDRQWLRTG